MCQWLLTGYCDYIHVCVLILQLCVRLCLFRLSMICHGHDAGDATITYGRRRWQWQNNMHCNPSRFTRDVYFRNSNNTLNAIVLNSVLGIPGIKLLSTFLTSNMLLCYSGDNLPCILFVGSQRKASTTDIRSSFRDDPILLKICIPWCICVSDLLRIYGNYHIIHYHMNVMAPFMHDPIFSLGGMGKHECSHQLCYGYLMKQWLLTFGKRKIPVKIPMTKWWPKSSIKHIVQIMNNTVG